MQPKIRTEQLQFEDPTLRIRINEFHWNPIAHEARLQSKPVFWHFHKEAEIVLILDGFVDFFIEEEMYELTPGDVVLVSPQQLHASTRRQRTGRSQIVCHFDLQHYLDLYAIPYSSYFSDFSSPLSRFNRLIRSNKTLNDHIFQSVMIIRRELEARELGYDLSIGIQIKTILLHLLRNEPQKIRYHTNGALSQLRPVLDYVDHHLGEKIRLKDVSALFNVSYHHFSRFFKKTVGMSFIDYVNYMRIKKAERLLVTSEANVMDIACQIGIPNMAHFYEMFRKFNDCSPAEFKKKKLH